MKFECPQCGKKYSLPDSKIPRGKDFKVKCKKCGEVIILSAEPEEQAAPAPQADYQAGSPFAFGQQPSAPEEEPTKVFDYSQMEDGSQYAGAAGGQYDSGAGGEYGTEPEWHIAVDGEQMGPYSVEQMQEMLAAGQIDEETYLWKDGFDDWLPMRDIPEFQQAGYQAAAAASYPPAQAADPYAQQQAADPYAQQQAADPYAQQTTGAYGGQQAQAPSSLFSEAFSAPEAGAGALQAPQASQPMAHDLFRPKSADEAEASPFDNTGGEVVTSSPGIPDSPRVDATQLKGARHDDSVLFSLGSLQALASSSREPARAITSTAEGGSGLIDIRSLAGGAGPAPGAYSESRTEDILSIGGGGIGVPIGMPSLMQPSENKPNVMLYIFGGVGAFALLGVIVLLVGIFGLGWGRGVPDDDGTKAALDEEALKMKLMAEIKATMGEEEKGDKGEEKVVASVTGSEEAKEETSGSEESGAEGTKKKKGGKKKDKDSGGGGGGPDLLSSTPSKELSPGQKKTHDSLLDLIDEATSKKGKSSKDTVKEPKEEKKAPTPAPTVNLPSTPNKNDVLKAMKKVSPGVKKCAKGQTGTATVSIIFGGSTGKVTKAVVISGPFKGTPAATCIGGAVKKASVPKFKQSSFSVTYPFVIK